MNLAVYPGSFDPITNGHVDIVRRASAVFDRVVIAVLANPRKTPLLAVDQRIAIIRSVIGSGDLPGDRIEVDSFDGLTVDYCRSRGASAIVRGLRAISDFEVEMQMAQTNHAVTGVHTVFLPTASNLGYLSSRFIREIAREGGDVTHLVPEPVARRLKDAYRR